MAARIGVSLLQTPPQAHLCLFNLGFILQLCEADSYFLEESTSSGMINSLNKAQILSHNELSSQLPNRPVYPILLTSLGSTSSFRQFPVEPHTGIASPGHLLDKSTLVRFEPGSHGQNSNVLTTQPCEHYNCLLNNKF